MAKSYDFSKVFYENVEKCTVQPKDEFIITKIGKKYKVKFDIPLGEVQTMEIEFTANNIEELESKVLNFLK